MNVCSGGYDGETHYIITVALKSLLDVHTNRKFWDGVVGVPAQKVNVSLQTQGGAMELLMETVDVCWSVLGVPYHQQPAG